MSRLWKKILACFFMMILVFTMTGCKNQVTPAGKQKASAPETEKEVEKEPLRLWYTDSKMEPFLIQALSRFEELEGIKVIPELVSSVEYMEALGEASLSEETRPDVYIAKSDFLEKAELAGLVLENNNEAGIYTEEHYPATALRASEYKGKLYGYPLTFDTGFLLYNADYVSSVPASFDEILTFADNFEPAEGVENILKWDVSNIFYNYFFAAAYLEMGGAAGDDRSIFNIDNQQVKDCLTYFQNLSQFFAIDTKTVTYDTVLQEFLEGKTIFTIGRTDALYKIEEAKAEGTLSFSYGTAVLPDLTETLETKGLSVTELVLVNGYTEKKEESVKLAQFLSFDEASVLYETWGRLPARKGAEDSFPQIQGVMAQYEDAVEVPKIMEAGNYWVNMEIAFSSIWSGSDVSEQIQHVSEVMKEQLAE